MLGLYQVKWLSDEYAHKTIYFCVKSCTSDLLGWKRQLINNGLPAELLWSWCVPHRQWVAVASAGPCPSLHLAPDRQPHQNPTILFFTGRMPFLPPNQQRQSTVLCVPVCEYFVLMTIHRNILFDWCFVHPGNTGEGVRCEPGYWRICSIGLSRRENTEMCESIVATHYASNKGIPEVCWLLTYWVRAFVVKIGTTVTQVLE